jgi:hypothetical protein
MAADRRWADRPAPGSAATTSTTTPAAPADSADEIRNPAPCARRCPAGVQARQSAIPSPCRAPIDAGRTSAVVCVACFGSDACRQPGARDRARVTPYSVCPASSALLEGTRRLWPGSPRWHGWLWPITSGHSRGARPSGRSRACARVTTSTPTAPGAMCPPPSRGVYAAAWPGPQRLRPIRREQRRDSQDTESVGGEVAECDAAAAQESSSSRHGLRRRSDGSRPIGWRSRERLPAWRDSRARTGRRARVRGRRPVGDRRRRARSPRRCSRRRA